MKKKSKITTRSLVVTAMLSAIAFVLMFIEFPIPIMPSFVKMDISDLPALIGAFAIGPWCGVVIELLKNLLHILIKGTSSAYVGEFFNFFCGAVFALSAGYIYKAKRSRGGAILASIIGCVLMALVSLPLNYFVVYPAYVRLYGMPLQAIVGMYQAILGIIAEIPTTNALFNCLIIFNVPFTLFKGLVDAIICFLIYKRISPLLHGRKKA